MSSKNDMGWRSVTGSAIFGLGWVLKSLSSIWPELNAIGDILIGIGAALGGYGFRKAIKKTGEKS
jgi:uncharacterized membrane protein YedE/YeeE